ncbi:hypothetical protein D9M68_981400 [compost metagenome]
MARAQRSTKRLASLADRAICHIGRPNVVERALPTATALVAGSMQVRPCAACSEMARASGAGLWPNMAPVSPRQKSLYRTPSAQVSVAPSACATNSVAGLGQSRIQCSGTPKR